MSLLQGMLRDTGEWWRTFVQAVWPSGVVEATRSEADRLDAVIARRGGRLVALRGRIDRLLAGAGRASVRRRLAKAARLERLYADECLALDRLRQSRRALRRGEAVVIVPGPD